MSSNYSHLKYNFSQDRIHSITVLIQNNYIQSDNGLYHAMVLESGNLVVFKHFNHKDKSQVELNLLYIK